MLPLSCAADSQLHGCSSQQQDSSCYHQVLISSTLTGGTQVWTACLGTHALADCQWRVVKEKPRSREQLGKLRSYLQAKTHWTADTCSGSANCQCCPHADVLCKATAGCVVLHTSVSHAVQWNASAADNGVMDRWVVVVVHITRYCCCTCK